MELNTRENLLTQALEDEKHAYEFLSQACGRLHDAMDTLFDEQPELDSGHVTTWVLTLEKTVATLAKMHEMRRDSGRELSNALVKF